jgi:hypothetical protein
MRSGGDPVGSPKPRTAARVDPTLILGQSQRNDHHGELSEIGIDVAERTVARLMPKRRLQPSQTWRTFLDNHVRDLVAARPGRRRQSAMARPRCA